MLEIIIDFAAITISIAALAMPHLLASRRAKLTSLDLEPFQRVELGYSLTGPTLAVIATLRASYQDVFVVSIKNEVRRRRDNTTHKFDWVFFRSLILNKDEREAATAFTVPLSGDKRVNIVFADWPTGEQFRDEAVEYRRLFGAHATSESVWIPDLAADELANYAKQFGEGAGRASRTDLFSKVDREFYWTADTYELDIEVKTGSGQSFVFEYEFQLNEDESTQLRHNVIAVLEETLTGLARYNFVTPTLRRR